MSTQVLTANRLSDGLVVYLGSDDRWIEVISDAAISRSDSDETRLLKVGSRSVAARQVVDPYLIEVREEGCLIRPVRFREAIRAGGPTIETAPAAMGLAG